MRDIESCLKKALTGQGCLYRLDPCSCNIALAKCGGMLRPDLGVEKRGNKIYLNKKEIVRTRSLYFQVPWVDLVRAIFFPLSQVFDVLFLADSTEQG